MGEAEHYIWPFERAKSGIKRHISVLLSEAHSSLNAGPYLGKEGICFERTMKLPEGEQVWGKCYNLMQLVLSEAFGLKLSQPYLMRLEWAPSPAEEYLGDLTSFDAYIQGRDTNGELVGLGIEVKYTERGYKIGATEAKRVGDRASAYWVTTRESGLFIRGGCAELADDDLRQIWRNHLLGLAMVRRKDIGKFVSVTLYPAGNQHFTHALTRYRGHLEATAQGGVRGCTFEQYINSLRGDEEIEAWKEYLKARYLFEMPA